MKVILGLLLAMSVGHVANAKVKEVSKRQLNTILKNSWVVAKVKHPGAGIKLFDACVDGDVFRSNKRASRCAEYEYVIDEDDKYDLNPRKRKTCVKWEKYDPIVKVERQVSKDVNCRWTNGLKNPERQRGDSPHDQFVICDKEWVSKGFPMSQVIEIYNLYDARGSRVYYNSAVHEDRAQPGYRKATYTIPACEQ